jgi:hypothetical protein
MTREEAIAIAERVAKEAGWRWEQPIHAQRVRSFLLFGRASWHVMSNADKSGCNVNVWIDDATGDVKKQAFAPG